MRKTSVSDLHNHTSELVREAAELRPVRKPAPMAAGKNADIFNSMRQIWARLPETGDSTKIVEEDRNR